MKSAKNVKKDFNFWQVDNRIERINEDKGLIILPSPLAWEKFAWLREWFKEKPKEGYFIWVKKQLDFPLSACVTIASAKVKQSLTNILVIEKNIKAKANVMCHAAKNDLAGTHVAIGKLVLKEGSFLEYNHVHKWGEKDLVNPDYQFVLEKDSRLIYNYQNLFPAKKLNLVNSVIAKKNSSAQISFVVNGDNSEISLNEEIVLKEENAQAVLKLRLVGRKNSQITAKSRVVAKAPVKGHLDCQGLLVDEKSTISLTPELVCENRMAQITHEASIGRISEEELNYLRMRGLTESEAIDLIVSGFLKA